jgi:hypothetical protein
MLPKEGDKIENEAETEAKCHEEYQKLLLNMRQEHTSSPNIMKKWFNKLF